MNIAKRDLLRAAVECGVSDQQAEILWSTLEGRQARSAGFDVPNAAYYLGVLVVMTQAVECALASAGPAKSVGQRYPAKGLDADPLTPREREAARLVAQGQTNRQIAATLVISERTADAHVQNILNKLGFSSRVQIAAWAVERGLTASPLSQTTPPPDAPPSSDAARSRHLGTGEPIRSGTMPQR